MVSSKHTRRYNKELFWGEISPCEHILQLYEDDEVFFDALTKFVAEGLLAEEAVIVLATGEHLNVLEQRLAAKCIDIQTARLRNQFIVRDADEVLSKLLVNNWPDREVFMEMVTELLTLARGSGRRVRAFGELVAVMWARGLNGATVNLEHLWHELIEKEGFPLFCAYPKSGFTQDCVDSIKEICDAHSQLINGKTTRKAAYAPVAGEQSVVAAE